jgi:hypothetical protein
MNSIFYFLLLVVIAMTLIGMIQYVVSAFENHENERPMEDEVWAMRKWKLAWFTLLVLLTTMVPMLLAITVKAVVVIYYWL